MPEAGSTLATVTPLQVLVVDDEQTIRKTVSLCLAQEGHRVVAVGTVEDARIEARRTPFDLALLDVRLGMADGLTLIPALLADCPWLKIVIITAYATVDQAVEAMRRGAFDYLPKPFTPAQIQGMAAKVGQVRALEHRLQTLQLSGSGLETDLDSAAPAMQRTIALARQVAGSDATVLLRGEHGTGKTLLAKAIHRWSERRDHTMAVVACPSLAGELLESELFGHAKGAFTGAVRDQPGRIAQCDGGTLFLDEIGDLPLALQPKLLRFLQDRTFERVGDPTPRVANVRFIAATNQDLEALVRAGRFREDLLYRLNVIPIELPPLRERQEDILPLAERLLGTFARGRHFLGFTPEARAALIAARWPGNVRELRNVIERACILAPGPHIGLEHLPPNLQGPVTSPQVGDLVPLERIEEAHIRRVLAQVPALEDAARILGIDSATLWRRRKRYGLS